MGAVPAATVAAAMAAACAQRKHRTCSGTACSAGEGAPQERWTLRDCPMVPGAPALELWEGRFVFADGAGVRVWPATGCLAAYLQDLGPDSDRAGPSTSCAAANWQGRRVLELGCGCGALAIVLAGWGCESVLATDASPKALELAAANVERHCQGNKVTIRRFDWCDVDACEALQKDFGPFHMVVAADAVLAAPPAGPMWHRGEAEGGPALASRPGPLLEATRRLSRGGGEVVLAVTDRCGDVRETARELLERRHWLELLSPPRELVPEGGKPVVTVFHFRWKECAGTGGEVTQKLWGAL